MGGGDVEFFGKLGVCDDVFHVLRQALPHVVVDLIVGLLVAVKRRSNQEQEEDEKDREGLGQELCHALHVRDNRAMARMLKRFVEYQNQRGQDRHAADDAEDDTLCHDDSEVTSQREAHEAERDEACNRCNRAADHAGQRFADCIRHGIAFVGVQGALLVVTVPEEDGVIHRNGKLQDRRQRFCNVGNFTEEVVGSEVDQNHCPDGGKEDERDQEAVQEDQHRNQRKRHRNADVDRFLFFAKVLQVGDQRRHAGNKALLAGNRPDFANGVHRHVR